MTKYFGIITLIIGLTTAWYLDNQIVSTKMIISDYTKSEISTGKYHLDHYRELKRNNNKDSSLILIKKLYDDILLSDPYATAERKKVFALFNKEEEEALSNTANIVLFNTFCNNWITQEQQKIDKREYALIIDEIKQFKNDSVDISISEVTLITDNYQIEYYYNNEIIPHSQLKGFSGEFEHLEAKITDPLTGQIRKIKGE